MPKKRDVKYIRTIVNGVGHFEIWIESICGTYYEKAPQSNFMAQDISIAQWDLMRGRPNPLADEIALYPLTVTNPSTLMKGKNK